MRFRRTLVSAALVAAVISPAALFSAAPAFAAPAAAQAQSDSGSLSELEKADAAALKTKETAKTALDAAKAYFEANGDNPKPYRENFDKAEAEAKKAADAFEAADKELSDASYKLIHDPVENRPKNQARVDAAEKAFIEAGAAKTKADNAVATAKTALHNARVEEGRKVDRAQDAYDAASKAYDIAHKAYLDAKAAGQPSTEQPADKPGAVTPASATTVTTADTATTVTTADRSTSTSTTATKSTTAKAATTGSTTELAETGSNPATSYLALGSGLALSLGAAALYVSRRQQARGTS